MINRLRNPWDAPGPAEGKGRPCGPVAETDWQDLSEQAASRAGNFIAAHPVASLAAAFALGSAVGWWVKRT